MKSKPTFIIIIALAFMILLSACSGSAFGATSWPGLTVNQSTAYLSDNQFVFAINLDNGSLIWRYPEKPDSKKTFYAPPVLLGNEQLIVGSYDHALYSLDPGNGQVKWSFAEAKDRYIGSPLVVGETILAPNADDHLYALDSNGRLLWTFQAKGPLWSQPVFEEKCGCIYLSSMDHHLYAIDVTNGQLLWSKDLGAAMVGSPALSPEGVLYIGTFGSRFFALDSSNQQTLWETPTVDWVWSGPALQEDTLYFGDLKGTIYAVDATNGTVLWQVQPDGPVISTPLLKDGNLLVTTEVGSLYVLDLKGNVVRNAAIGGNLFAPAATDNDLILVTPNNNPDGLLVALNPDGSQKWAFVPPK